MLDQQPVAVSRRRDPRISNPPLKHIPITEPKLVDIKPQGHRQRQSTLPRSPVTNRLRRDVEIVRRDLHVLSKPERESGADALVHRMADVATESKRAEHVEINIFRDRNRELNFTPELIVSLIDNLRRREASQHKQQQARPRALPQLAPFEPCGGKTVNEVSATTTRSPTCSRVALASGFGRVAMIDLVGFRSGVSVVR